MATYDEIQQDLQDALNNAINQTNRSPGHVQLETNSRAVLNLAEALAWLQSPSQPHGGSRNDG